MGLFGPQPRRRPSRFDKIIAEEDDKRVHFKRLQYYERPAGRNPIWLVIMVMAVLALIYYLTKI